MVNLILFPKYIKLGNTKRVIDYNYRPCTIYTRCGKLPILPPLCTWQPIFVSVESFSGIFQSSSPLRRNTEPPVQAQGNIITVWTIRHPTHNRNEPIEREELYKLSYIPPSHVEFAWIICFFYSYPRRYWAMLDLNWIPHLRGKSSHLRSNQLGETQYITFWEN